MDLLPFQAGLYASDEEETEYLESDLDCNPTRGVKLEAPEEDDDVTEIPDNRPGQAHATDETYEAGLATQPDSSVCAQVPETREILPQAAVETSEDTRTVEAAPDIEFDFGDEPTIEISSISKTHKHIINKFYYCFLMLSYQLLILCIPFIIISLQNTL